MECLAPRVCGPVETGLLELPGVVNVRIALLLEKGEVLFDSALLEPGPDLIQAKVQSLGYKCVVTLTKRHGDLPKRCVMYSCNGLLSPSSAIDIERELMSYAGVHSAKMSVSRGLLLVRLSNEEGMESPSIRSSNPSHTTTQSSFSSISQESRCCNGARDVIEIVGRVGYTVSYLSELEQSGDIDDTELLAGYCDANNTLNTLVDGEDSVKNEDLKQWSHLLVIALALGVPVVLLHVLTMMSRSVRYAMMEPSVTAVCGNGLMRGQLIMFALNLPLQILVGGKFYRQAYSSAKHSTLYGLSCCYWHKYYFFVLIYYDAHSVQGAHSYKTYLL